MGTLWTLFSFNRTNPSGVVTLCRFGIGSRIYHFQYILFIKIFTGSCTSLGHVQTFMEWTTLSLRAFEIEFGFLAHMYALHRPQVWEPQMLVICVCTSAPPTSRKFFKLGSLKWPFCAFGDKFLAYQSQSVNKVFFAAETCYLRWKHFIHNSCSFSTCFTSHSYVICWNHGMKIKILFSNWLILPKMQSLDTYASFYLVVAGQRV